MKIFVQPFGLYSQAMIRVANALRAFAPAGTSVAPTLDAADLVVLHVIGYDGMPELLETFRSRGQRYAIIQYCMRSTQRPNTRDWMPIWHDAEVVWSYYDLRKICAADGQTVDFNFYHAPLGVDARVFQNHDQERTYEILTSGYVAETEGVNEAAEATRRVGGKQFHLGPDMPLGDHVTCNVGITDQELADAYSRSKFVAGLRRCEGFELPVLEGVMCGARPIVFDAPHYRDWYGDFAEIIPEGDFEQVTAALVEIFQRGPTVVSRLERDAIKSRFNWKTIARDFWSRVRSLAIV